MLAEFMFALFLAPHGITNYVRTHLLDSDRRYATRIAQAVGLAAQHDLLATALREAQEEIGLDPKVVEVLGPLPPVDTITGYCINPFVGVIPHPYDFRPNPLEVKRLLLLPLEGFYEAGRWSAGVYHYQGRATRVYYWRYNREVIWGATAQILLDLLARLGQHPIPGDQDATYLD